MWLLLNASSARTFKIYCSHKITCFSGFNTMWPHLLTRVVEWGSSLYDRTASGVKRLNDQIFCVG